MASEFNKRIAADIIVALIQKNGSSFIGTSEYLGKELSANSTTMEKVFVAYKDLLARLESLD